MLDEIREQGPLVCHLCIERVLIAGARALYGAGMARRGNRQLRPQPGFFLPEQGNLFRLFCNGGWARLRVEEGGQIAAGGDGDFALGITAVSGLPGGLVEGGFRGRWGRFLLNLHGAALPLRCKLGFAAVTFRHIPNLPMVHCHNGGGQFVTTRPLHRWLSEVDPLQTIS
jgi:hypothetical protein